MGARGSGSGVHFLVIVPLELAMINRNCTVGDGGISNTPGDSWCASPVYFICNQGEMFSGHTCVTTL